MALEAARIKSLPDTAYYIPEFITEEEEERLLQKVIIPFTWLIFFPVFHALSGAYYCMQIQSAIYSEYIWAQTMNLWNKLLSDYK